MWALEDELERHFDRVKERREAGITDSEDDDRTGLTVRNEYARGRGRAR
jgi:hypothetical protein